MTDYATINWSFDRATGVGTVELDRPDAMNAISEAMLDELVEAFERFDDLDRGDDGVRLRVVRLEAAGTEAFSVGADIDEFGEVQYPHVDDDWHAAMDAVADCPAPVIAVIDGYCVGGGLELALACDFRVASHRSTFGFPEIDIGIVPNGGGTQRLAALVGPARTKELCMTGAFVDAATAVDDGFVTRATDADDLDAEATAFTERLAGKPPLAVRVVKDLADRSAEVGLRDGLAYEREASLPLYYTDDYEEGIAAFTADREPEWQGR